MADLWGDGAGQGLVGARPGHHVIAVAVIVAMLFFRGQLSNDFSNIGNNRGSEA